jgi:hypothetical protein
MPEYAQVKIDVLKMWNLEPSPEHGCNSDGIITLSDRVLKYCTTCKGWMNGTR